MSTGDRANWRDAGPPKESDQPDGPFSFAVLHLPDGLGAPGYLILGTTSGQEICICFSKTLIRLIFALHEALKTDEHRPRKVRGWRSAKRLARAIANQDEYLIEVQPNAIVHNVWAVNRAIRRAAEKHGLRAENPDSLKIIRTRSGWGYRLLLSRLAIVQGSDTAV